MFVTCVWFYSVQVYSFSLSLLYSWNAPHVLDIIAISAMISQWLICIIQHVYQPPKLFLSALTLSPHPFCFLDITGCHYCICLCLCFRNLPVNQHILDSAYNSYIIATLWVAKFNHRAILFHTAVPTLILHLLSGLLPICCHIGVRGCKRPE